MYINLIAIFCFAIGIIGKKTEKKYINPISIFCFLWGIIIFLSNLRWYTLYEAHLSTYIYILIGICAFVIGYYIFRLLTKNKGLRIKLKDGKNNNDKAVLRKGICYVFLILCLLFVSKNFIRYGSVLFKYGFNLASVQTVLQEEDLSSSGLENAISFLIVNPMYLALTVVIIINYINGDKDKKLLFLLLLMTLGRVFTTGGRQSFIQVFIIAFIGMAFGNSKIKDKIIAKTKNRKKILLIISAIIVLLLLSISRSSNIVKTIYLDFAMQPYMFEYWGDVVDSNNLYAYGFSSIFGFVYPILYVFKNLLGFSQIPSFFNVIYEMNMSPINEWIYIGRILRANAYTSIFWYLYYDFRLIGIIIGMVILGMISYNVFIKASRFPTIKNISVYGMIALTIFYSFGDMEFSKYNFALALIYIEFLFFKQVRKKE